MTNSVFQLVHVDTTQVVLKVVAEDNLTIAMHPYISGEYDYITVSRGGQKILTIVYKDGHTFSYEFGPVCTTMVDGMLTRLRNEACTFIESQGILLDLTTDDIKEACIFYNSNYKKWQLNVTSGIYWSNTAQSFEEMQNEVKRFIIVKGWKEGVAEPGIKIWNAQGPIKLTTPKCAVTNESTSKHGDSCAKATSVFK